MQGVPPALTQRCNYCEFRDGCQWRLGMSHEHLSGFLGEHPTYSPLLAIEEEPSRWKHQYLGVAPTQAPDYRGDGCGHALRDTGVDMDVAVGEAASQPPNVSLRQPEGEKSAGPELASVPVDPYDAETAMGLAGTTFVPLDETLAIWPPPPPAPASSSSNGEQGLWLGEPSPTDADWDAVEAAMLKSGPSQRLGQGQELGQADADRDSLPPAAQGARTAHSPMAKDPSKAD